jgi:hypothetical protein
LSASKKVFQRRSVSEEKEEIKEEENIDPRWDKFKATING